MLLAHPDAIALPPDQIARGEVVVAEVDGTVLGFAAILARDDGETELDGLFVEPKDWRVGIGRRLLEACCDMARARGPARPGGDGMKAHDDRVIAFRRLHASGCFVMPNPWDVGSARTLESIGFKALATTSAGFAWTLGRADNQVTLAQVLEHLRAIAATVKVPVNADFEGGFAVDPEHVAANVRLAAATGVAGLSIEDSTGNTAHPLHPFDLSVERIRAARQAIDDSGTGIVLTGRSEGFVCGRPDIVETIRRLRAYAEAGADCVYAPRIDRVDHVAAIVTAVSPKPVNLLINAPFITVAEAASLGVRRISVGGTLARAAWGGFLESAREMAEHGTFSRFVGLPNVDALFRER